MNIFSHKSIDELKSDLIEEKKKLMALRFMHAGSQLKDTSLIKKTRKCVAQILTTLAAVSIKKGDKNA